MRVEEPSTLSSLEEICDKNVAFLINMFWIVSEGISLVRLERMHCVVWLHIVVSTPVLCQHFTLFNKVFILLNCK